MQQKQKFELLHWLTNNPDADLDNLIAKLEEVREDFGGGSSIIVDYEDIHTFATILRRT